MCGEKQERLHRKIDEIWGKPLLHLPSILTYGPLYSYPRGMAEGDR